MLNDKTTDTNYILNKHNSFILSLMLIIIILFIFVIIVGVWWFYGNDIIILGVASYVWYMGVVFI